MANGAPLYEENNSGQTACDCAIQNGFTEIASFLESKMVFSVSDVLIICCTVHVCEQTGLWFEQRTAKSD